MPNALALKWRHEYGSIQLSTKSFQSTFSTAMKRLLLLFPLLLGALSPAWAVDEPTPAIMAFAEKLEGITWNLLGTNSLKKLRFDGEAMHPVGQNGREGAAYDTSFIDVGIVRLDFTGNNTGWYFFDADLRFITPCTVSTELVFELGEGKVPRPVQRFPEDVTGVAYQLVKDERGLNATQLRWSGTQLELAVQQPDQSWKVEKMTGTVAGDRIIEAQLQGKTVWAVFSSDGQEAWLIELENCFGGEREGAPLSPAAAITGLTAQQSELLSHLTALKAAGEKIRAATLERQLIRSLSGNTQLLQELDKHLKQAP